MVESQSTVMMLTHNWHTDCMWPDESITMCLGSGPHCSWGLFFIHNMILELEHRWDVKDLQVTTCRQTNLSTKCHRLWLNIITYFLPFFLCSFWLINILWWREFMNDWHSQIKKKKACVVGDLGSRLCYLIGWLILYLFPRDWTCLHRESVLLSSEKINYNTLTDIYHHYPFPALVCSYV